MYVCCEIAIVLGDPCVCIIAVDIRSLITSELEFKDSDPFVTLSMIGDISNGTQPVFSAYFVCVGLPWSVIGDIRDDT